MKDAPCEAEVILSQTVVEIVLLGLGVVVFFEAAMTKTYTDIVKFLSTYSKFTRGLIFLRIYISVAYSAAEFV